MNINVDIDTVTERVEKRDVLVGGPALVNYNPHYGRWTSEDTDTEEIVASLQYVAERYKLQNLAAPEIGILINAVLIRDDNNNPVILFNPQIVNYSSNKHRWPETCPSFPGLKVYIKRALEVRVRYIDPADSEIKTATFTGLPAFNLQHAMTHIEGRPFWQDASWIGLAQAKRRLKQLARQFKHFGERVYYAF